jgi:hypothetical protein
VPKMVQWLQMQYPISIVITSFNIFVRNVLGLNISTWSVQSGNDTSTFSTLLTSSTQLNANNYYSFNIDNSVGYKVYGFNILTQTGGSDKCKSLLQFNRSNIMANAYFPMAANLIMNRNKIINIRDPVAGREVTTVGLLDQSLNSLENLPVNELTNTILGKIGDKHLDLKG